MKVFMSSSHLEFKLCYMRAITSKSKVWVNFSTSRFAPFYFLIHFSNVPCFHWNFSAQQQPLSDILSVSWLQNEIGIEKCYKTGSQLYLEHRQASSSGQLQLIVYFFVSSWIKLDWNFLLSFKQVRKKIEKVPPRVIMQSAKVESANKEYSKVTSERFGRKFEKGAKKITFFTRFFLLIPLS